MNYLDRLEKYKKAMKSLSNNEIKDKANYLTQQALRSDNKGRADKLYLMVMGCVAVVMDRI